jgi:hypothetical protein
VDKPPAAPGEPRDSPFSKDGENMPTVLATIFFPAILAAPMITTPQLALLGIIVAVTTIMLISTRRKIREAKNTPRTYARELYSRLKEEKTTINEVQEVMIEMEELARHIHGRIDTRYAKLEKVIRDADERIDKLSRLVRAAQGDATADVTVADTEPSKDSRSDKPEEVPAAHADVCRLADAGLRPMDIAKEVGSTIGEVELILALRKTRRAATAPAESISDAPQRGSPASVS